MRLLHRAYASGWLAVALLTFVVVESTCVLLLVVTRGGL